MPLALLATDPVAFSLLLLALVWLAAKLGGEVALRLKLPAVAGELGAGLALAALHHGFPAFPALGESAEVGVLASLGVVVLMFSVGLESTVPQMMRVGFASLRVALIGVVIPMGLGLGGACLLMPSGTPFLVDLFVGACLCATSIGISAQVLREKGMVHSPEGRVIVGAAVIDDVLGLLVLVTVSSLVVATAAGGAMPWGTLLRSLGLAVAFLLGALTLGRGMAPHIFRVASRLRSEQLLLPLGLGFAFLMAWMGSLAGLATIVGAYAAGLILEPSTIETLEERESRSLDALLHPLVTVLAPIFFVIMGARVDVSALVAPRTLLVAGGLGLLGIVGKYLAGLAGGRGLRSTIIGWGMVPRGEVGLIFVAVGAQMQLQGRPLLDGSMQAALVGAILLTTLVGPVGLGYALSSKVR